MSSICFDPDTPCLYATGAVTDKKGRETSVLICYSIAKFLRMHMLMAVPPTKPALRRIHAPPPEPEPEIEGMEDSDDEMDVKAAKKQAKKEKKESDQKEKLQEDDLKEHLKEGTTTARGKHTTAAVATKREDFLADVLRDCTEAELLTKDAALEILDSTDAIEDIDLFKERVEEQILYWEPKLKEYEEEHPELSRQHSNGNDEEQALLEDGADGGTQLMSNDLDMMEAGHADDDVGMEAIMAMDGAHVKQQSTFGKIFSQLKGEEPAEEDPQAALHALSKHLGLDPRRVARMHAPKEETAIRARKDKTIDIVRSEINPHKGQRLPFVAAGYRMLIPGCLYSYTIEVKNGGGSFSWLSIEDPQEPFTQFVMCEPAGCNVRIAEIRKPDGRKSYSVVWKVGVPASESKKLTIIVRAETRPIYTKRLEACHVLFRGEKKITAMLWIETGPVLGFQDGNIISFGAYIPPKDPLSRMAWDEIGVKAVMVAKRLASIPVGRSRAMRCKKCLVCLACCWNPFMCCWKCWKRRDTNAQKKIMPQERYSTDVDTEKLRSMRDGEGQGAYTNVDRRLLMGFKRSARLRDGSRDDNMEHTIGKPVQCMWYNKEDRELFFGVRDLVASIDVTARMNPWASPTQVLPAEDYMTDLAVVGSSIKGLMNVHGDDDLLVTSEDGSVRRLFLVKSEATAFQKLWTKHVLDKLMGLQTWLDEKLGHITPGGKKEKDLALDLKSINGNMFSVRHDGEIARWAPHFQLMQWKKHTADLLPKHIHTKIKMTSVGSVNVVKQVIDEEFKPSRTMIRATQRIGAIHLFMLVCESPMRMKSDIKLDKEKQKKQEEFSGGSDSDYYSDEYYSDDEPEPEESPQPASGVAADGDPEGEEDEPEELDMVHTPADQILLWNAKTGKPIPLEEATLDSIEEDKEPRLGDYPKGNICCVTISAGYIIIGRDCGNLTGYNLEVSGAGQEHLVAAQEYEGHDGKPIELLRTVGDLNGGLSTEMYCSSVLLYSTSTREKNTTVLVHELKSGSCIFKFVVPPASPGDAAKFCDFDVIRLSTKEETDETGQVHDHFIGAVDRDVQVWTLEGNIKDLVRFELHGEDDDDDELQDDEPIEEEDEDEDEEEKEDDQADLLFEMSAKPDMSDMPGEKEAAARPKNRRDRLHTHKGHTKLITCMEVRGNYAFTGCKQGSIRVWRCAAPWSNLLVLNTTEGPVSRMIVPDLSTIWVAYGGFIRAWDLRAVHADMARQTEIDSRPKMTDAFHAAQHKAQEEEDNKVTEAEIHSSSTGASTAILPVGHNGIPTVRSLAAVPEVISEGKKLHQTYNVYASCVDGSVYCLTPLTKQPIYTTQTHVAKERREGSVLAVMMCMIEYLQLIGISFTVTDALWPPALSLPYRFFGSLFGTTSSFTEEGWSASFWGALIFGGFFLGAMIAQISTNLLTREEFAWKFGGSTGGVVVLTHFGCIGLRVVDFVVGVVLFITIARPLLTTFVCGGLGATEEQEAQCWAMGHLMHCAIAGGGLYIYVKMSWRIQRAYGNCGLFASRSLADLFATDRDNVHNSRVHHLVNYPRYCDCSMYVRFLCTAASVFCFTQTMALAVICVLCFILFATVLYKPPFAVAAVNFCALGTTAAALLTNVVLLKAAWALKDIDHITSQASIIETRQFATFQDPEALISWAGTGGVAMPRGQVCFTVSAEHDHLVEELGSIWLYAILLAPLWLKLGCDWAHFSFIKPNVARAKLWMKMRIAKKQRRKLKEIERLKKQLGFV